MSNVNFCANDHCVELGLTRREFDEKLDTLPERLQLHSVEEYVSLLVIESEIQSDFDRHVKSGWKPTGSTGSRLRR